ncbi:MAG TPA: hypothetical protein VN939_06505, partial [Chthoniobacterales bacterium]|nr:hypothetical protein [Chthoniobacterales bacterium]
TADGRRFTQIIFGFDYVHSKAFAVDFLDGAQFISIRSWFFSGGCDSLCNLQILNSGFGING